MAWQEDLSHEQVETLVLRNVVMAALSQRHRHSAHPVDRLRLLVDATRITQAIQADFAVSRRCPAAAADPPAVDLLTEQS
jgi:hypothetical protein